MQIQTCQRCGLYVNQKPLLDVEKECKVFWVGLSAKKTVTDNEIPLSPNTPTGKLIQRIEDSCDGISTYKTNLVKCLPLTEQQKLRYPNRNEIDSCFGNLLYEIETMTPKIVFLLGAQVSSSVGRRLNIDFDKWSGFGYKYKEYKGIYFVPIHHPSYIYVYRRKDIGEYVNSVSKIVRKFL